MDSLQPVRSRPHARGHEHQRRLARELAAETGESLTDAVTEAIRERLARIRKRRRGVAVRLMAIADKNRDRPRLDERPEDEILGYDEHGLPR